MHWSTVDGMPEIIRGVESVLSGDRESGRAHLATLWEKWSRAKDRVQRCVIAHYLADTHDDAADELAWDREALRAATGFDDGDDHAPLNPVIAELMPSLLLKVGRALRRLGDAKAWSGMFALAWRGLVRFRMTLTDAQYGWHLSACWLGLDDDPNAGSDFRVGHLNRCADQKAAAAASPDQQGLGR